MAKQKLKRSILTDVRQALQNVPPPKESEDISRRIAIEEMYEDIASLLDDGHTFGTIAQVLEKNGIDINDQTLSQYFRDITKARKKAENRAKLEARKRGHPGRTVDSNGAIKATPSVQQISAEIIDDDDEIQ
ncbi:hypothetical protein [Acaryochloris marina]|uniref:Uncharacterized protein n=1 Tax=Acaryochloris marina (strain MBIC 11017) TaxID=329726 RepID=A8ZPA2_ACAM1|nr:hypothetical protein [Acaryochloris marina]ABW32838.1 hypothetical protein AM1_E0068 [Acaryochloris marina MBIC11017]